MANSPSLTEDNIEAYANKIDRIILTKLPDWDHEPELFHLVKSYQLYRHSKTRRKYRNEACQFHFGRYFTSKTIAAQPLPATLTADEEKETMLKQNGILSKVKTYTDEELNLAKCIFYNKSKEDYYQLKSVKEILLDLEISPRDYDHAFSTSDDKHFQLYSKRQPNKCFINNYFGSGLLAWKCNLDIQPVFNHYKAITYICDFWLK